MVTWPVGTEAEQGFLLLGLVSSSLLGLGSSWERERPCSYFPCLMVGPGKASSRASVCGPLEPVFEHLSYLWAAGSPVRKVAFEFGVYGSARVHVLILFAALGSESKASALSCTLTVFNLLLFFFILRQSLAKLLKLNSDL